MFIIKISKKKIRILLACILLLSLGFNIYSYMESIKFRNRYESIVCMTNQFNDSSLISFVVQVKKSKEEDKCIEIFHIDRGEVIQKIQSNPDIQREVKGYIRGITDLYVKAKAFPDKGYIIKIPMEPTLKVKNELLSQYNINIVDEVFILFPEQGVPYLMVLDQKERPLFYNFKGSTDLLLEKLKITM